MRINVAVTADDPTMVQALCVDQSYGMKGIAKSTNTGASFTEYLTGDANTNYLSNSADGTGTGGQGWYDLAFAIDPNNSNEIFIGGINTWASFNGGSSWQLKSI